MRDHWNTLWPSKWYRLITIIKWRPTRKQLIFSFPTRPMAGLPLIWIWKLKYKRCIAWLHSVYQISFKCLKLTIRFFFPIFSVEFLILFNFFFFSECETQSQRDHYCFNGGTCFRLPALETGPLCQCPEEFTGKRCEKRDLHPDV